MYTYEINGPSIQSCSIPLSTLNTERNCHQSLHLVVYYINNNILRYLISGATFIFVTETFSSHLHNAGSGLVPIQQLTICVTCSVTRSYKKKQQYLSKVISILSQQTVLISPKYLDVTSSPTCSKDNILVR